MCELCKVPVPGTFEADSEKIRPVFCVPGMGNNLAVKVRYGGKQRQPLVDGKGVHREV